MPYLYCKWHLSLTELVMCYDMVDSSYLYLQLSPRTNRNAWLAVMRLQCYITSLLRELVNNPAQLHYYISIATLSIAMSRHTIVCHAASVGAKCVFYGNQGNIVFCICSPIVPVYHFCCGNSHSQIHPAVTEIHSFKIFLDRKEFSYITSHPVDENSVTSQVTL